MREQPEDTATRRRPPLFVRFAHVLLPVVPALAGALLLFAAWQDGELQVFSRAGVLLMAVAMVGSGVAVAASFSARYAEPWSVALALWSWGSTISALVWAASNFSFTLQRGRQLFVRERGGRRTPVRPDAPRSIAPAGTPRERAARAWIDNGDSEWVSVAAFSKLSLDLVALGAPLELVRACHRSAHEEIEHTRACFRVAVHLDPGVARAARVRPVARLDEVAREPATHGSLAVDSLVQGAYLEEVSGRVAGHLAALAGDEVLVRETLLEIERDELSHAEHAWEVVAHCLQAGGADVRDALQRALPLPPTNGAALPPDLERFGIVSPALQSRIEGEVRAAVTRRLEEMLREARAA